MDRTKMLEELKDPDNFEYLRKILELHCYKQLEKCRDDLESQESKLSEKQITYLRLNAEFWNNCFQEFRNCNSKIDDAKNLVAHKLNEL